MTAPVLSPAVQGSLPVLSPAWWTQRLHTELQQRQYYGQLMQRYADGDHDDPTIQQRASEAFKRIMGLSKTNLTGLIIEATAERLGIQGFRFGDDPKGDEDAWRIWQGSDFDAESELGITAALTVGRSFVLVEPPQQGEDLPRLYAEDASQMIVAYKPGRRRERLAALKVWVDEWTAEQHATLYLPNFIYKLRKASVPGYMSVNTLGWQLRDENVTEERNPLGVVPVFELANRPSLTVGVVHSEIHDVISDQDACNHIALNGLIAAEYGAFRQKWATGIEVPINPATNERIEPFETAVNRLFVSENDNAKFGDFNATALEPYIAMYESRVKHMAAVSRTPLAVLLGVGDNVSADAIALSVSGLVQKVGRRAKHFEQPYEGAMRLAFSSINDPRALADNAQTIWVDPDVKSAAQAADASVKLTGGKQVIAVETAQEKYLGMTETERNRDRRWREEGDALGVLERILPSAPANPLLP